jgi:hypothetical protein
LHAQFSRSDLVSALGLTKRRRLYWRSKFNGTAKGLGHGFTALYNIVYSSGAAASGTVIWTVSSACTKSDGSVSDDPAFVAETAFASQTMAVANRMWAKSGQFTALTSGNNCIAGSSVIVKVTLSGTASSAINAYQAVLTVPRALVLQAN